MADDAKDNRMLLRLMLSGTGAKIEFACDGHEAVEKALSETFEHILMDIQMPRMDGHEATAILRANGYIAKRQQCQCFTVLKGAQYWVRFIELDISIIVSSSLPSNFIAAKTIKNLLLNLELRYSSERLLQCNLEPCALTNQRPWLRQILWRCR